MQALFVVIVAVGLSPRESTLTDQVDVIEVNHYYDENGKHVFDQVIFYDWCGKDERFHVRAWRKQPAQMPVRDWTHGDFVVVWQDGDSLRRVRATSIRETWTQYDPELAERQFLPQEKRRDLAKK